MTNAQLQFPALCLASTVHMLTTYQVLKFSKEPIESAKWRLQDMK